MRRVLVFKVNNQILEKDPSCSFEGIVSGTKGYLKARFSFNRFWDKCACVAVFSTLLKEYPVPLKAGECEIPPEVLENEGFYVRVVGKRKDGVMLTTNEIRINQIQGGGV